MDSSKQIKLGAVISYFAIAFNIIAGLIYTPWMVSQIGKSNYGLYTLSTSLISIFMMDFGIGASVARFLAKYKAEGKTQKIKDFLGIVYKLFLIITLIIFVALIAVYFFLPSIYKGLTEEELQKFKILYFVVATYSLFSFPFIPLDGILNSNEKFIQIKVCDLVRKIITISLVIIALSLNFGVTSLVVVNAFAGIVVILIKLYIVNTSTDDKPNFKCKDKKLYKDLFSFSVWITISAIMQRFIFNLSPSILGIVANSEEIAKFSPAVTLEGYFYTIAAAINGLFLPKISRYIANKDNNSITKLLIVVGKYQMILLGLLTVGFACVGKDFMVLWMGEDFVVSYYGATLLFIPDLLLYTQQIANTVLTAKNYVKWQAVGNIIMAVTCFSLSLWLSSRIGSLGMCLSIAIAYFVNYIFNNYIYIKKLNLNMAPFYKSCYLRMFIPIFGTVIISFLILKHINHIGWLWLILKGFIVVFVFAILTIVFGFSSKERKFLANKIKKYSL